MALPTSRNTTYAAGSQVKSADLNDLQDQIVDHESRIAGNLHGEREIVVDASAGQEGAGASYSEGPPGTWGGIGSATFQLPLREGDRLKSATMRGIAGAGVSWTFELYKIGWSTGATQIGSTQTSGTAATAEDLTISGLTTTLASGERVVAIWQGTGAPHEFYGLRFTYDRV